MTNPARPPLLGEGERVTDENHARRTARLNAAHWCRMYADELERGGWTEDAAHFRREARLLDA